jgi:hypothetical protein
MNRYIFMTCNVMMSARVRRKVLPPFSGSLRKRISHFIHFNYVEADAAEHGSVVG